MPRTQITVEGANNRVMEHNFYDLRMRFPTTGNIWFVDSGSATGGNGLSPEGAVNTIDAAINLCTASNGDIIVVMEGHAETIATAGGIAADVAGITIVGLGRGRNRPVITFATDAAASFNISAANVYVEGLVLVNAIASQTAMVNVTGAGVVIKDCEVQVSDGSTAALLGILTTDAADRLVIEGCHFHGINAVTAAIRIVGTDHAVVRHNYITGAYATTGALEQVTTAGNMHIYDGNTVANFTADGNNASIKVKSDTTGVIINNRLFAIDSSCPATTAGANMFWGGNYFAAADDTAGTLK